MRARLEFACVALALAAGCALPAPPPAAVALALPIEAPLARGQARVEGVRALGPYLEASLAGRGGTQGFLFVASDVCRAALAEGAIVRIAAARPLVRVAGANGATCSARGLASLASWRDTLPDRRASFLVVTAPAELRLVSEAPGFLLAAGVQGGAVRLNGEQVHNEKMLLQAEHIQSDGAIMLSVGKKKHVLLKVI